MVDQREIASKGGKARKKALTPERRSEIARKAVQARWAKHTKKRPSPSRLSAS